MARKASYINDLENRWMDEIFALCTEQHSGELSKKQRRVGGRTARVSYQLLMLEVYAHFNR